MAITKDDVVKFIESMTVLELSELVKELEEKFGVSAAAMAALSAVLRAAPVAFSAAAICVRSVLTWHDLRSSWSV